MKKLILHIGPGKCGSSTLQTYFYKYAKGFQPKVAYHFLDPQLIRELNMGDRADPESRIQVGELFRKSIRKYDVVLLSHEYLGSCFNAIEEICKLAEGIFSEVVVIGYSRPQGGYLSSCFSQWHFREPHRLKVDEGCLVQKGFHPGYYSYEEKFLMAHILRKFTPEAGDILFTFDWFDYYGELAERLSGFSATVHCGALPRDKSPHSLILDFCRLANLSCAVSDRPPSNHNLKFNDTIVESVSHMCLHFPEVIGAHDSDHLLEAITSTSPPPAPTIHSQSVLRLQTAIDQVFYASNMKFFEQYNLPQSSFPSETPILYEDLESVLCELIESREQNPDKARALIARNRAEALAILFTHLGKYTLFPKSKLYPVYKWFRKIYKKD